MQNYKPQPRRLSNRNVLYFQVYVYTPSRQTKNSQKRRFYSPYWNRASFLLRALHNPKTIAVGNCYSFPPPPWEGNAEYSAPQVPQNAVIDLYKTLFPVAGVSPTLLKPYFIHISMHRQGKLANGRAKKPILIRQKTFL